jgi:hypothetical protein
LLLCGVAAAEPRIDAKLSPHTIEAIRIQLSDIDADVSIAIEHVSARELVVTVETDRGILVRPIEISSRNRDDVAHAVALKVAELVEQALAMKPLAITAPPAFDVPIAIETVGHDIAVDDDRHGYLAEVGVDNLTAMHAAGGVEWRGDSVVLETVASVRGGPASERAVANGRMTIADTSAAVGLRLFTTHSIVALGVHADVGVRRLDVSGVAADGRVGESISYALAASPGADLRWLMTSRLELRAAVSALLTFDRPVFSFDGMARADVAAPAAVTTMSLVFRTP